jgi:hypothetical protein
MLLHLVLRTDDNGNVFLVRDGLAAEQADALSRDLAASAHKQHYSTHAYGEGNRRAVLDGLGVRG